ncbi:MAG TPA: hypothetical protein VF339_00960 [Gammaproteobacteria bacterium]
MRVEHRVRAARLVHRRERAPPESESADRACRGPPGNHVDRIQERSTTKVMPMFTRSLAFE